MNNVMPKRFYNILIGLLFGFLLIACQSQEIKRENSTIGTHTKSPADVYVSLGVEYMKLGINDVALEKLRKAVQVDPNSSDAQNVLGVLYEQLGEKALAEMHYEKAVYIKPSNSSAQNNYARFLCQSGEYSQADKHFRLAIQNPLYKSAIKAVTNAGVCALADNNIEKAEAYFRSALLHNKRYSPALLQMANLRAKQNNYLSVRAYLQRFRSVQKHTAASLWLGIQAERELENQDAVASYSLELRQFFPDSYEASLLEKSELTSPQ